MKGYTDLEQSKRLAEFLPLESADMFYSDIFIDGKHKYNSHYLESFGFKTFEDTKTRESTHLGFIPCWSLAVLLNVIPKHIGEFNVLRIDISTNDFAIWYDEIGFGVNNDLPNIEKESTIDACVEMIVKLHEMNLL